VPATPGKNDRKILSSEGDHDGASDAGSRSGDDGDLCHECM
jgi:hypothetical protein